MTVPSRQSDIPRRLPAWLLAGLIVAPVVFVGFLFREGYSADIRIMAVVYAIIITGIGMVRVFSVG